MNKKLNNIFVPVEVAKLAKEKGFNEWCACYFVVAENDYEINEFLARLDLFSDGNLISIPTHTQLIEWIFDNHKITVTKRPSGKYSVLNKDFECFRIDTKEHFEINEALTVALNLIETK